MHRLILRQFRQSDVGQAYVCSRLISRATGQTVGGSRHLCDTKAHSWRREEFRPVRLLVSLNDQPHALSSMKQRLPVPPSRLYRQLVLFSELLLPLVHDALEDCGCSGELALLVKRTPQEVLRLE